jgi:dTDP-4-amino-4,6-dideoxygalactose transaminase
MKIPLLDLKAQYDTIRGEIEAAIKEVVESQVFINGPKVQQFEKEAAAYCGSVFALGVSSGTDALLLSLMAAGIGPGDEVITTPYTFFATAGSIARLGAKPVFVDVNINTYNIDVNLIEGAITSKTRAIIPVHLFGQMCNMDVIMDLAKEHHLYVIEDACQAIGAEWKGKRAGSFGDFGCFSFFPSKNLGGFGDGGLITTNSVKNYIKIKTLREHGSVDKYHHLEIGGNFRLDALQAAVLNVKLKHLDEWTQKRRLRAEYYNDKLCSPINIITPHIQQYAKSVYNQYVVCVGGAKALYSLPRDEMIKKFKKADIGHAVYYPVPLHLQKCFNYLGYKEGDFEQAETLSFESLALPVYPELMIGELDYVINILKGA